MSTRPRANPWWGPRPAWGSYMPVCTEPESAPTKIERLEEEISNLKLTIRKLREERAHHVSMLGQMICPSNFFHRIRIPPRSICD